MSSDPDASYWRILDALGDGVILNDRATGVVVEANAAAAAMHGYARGSFLGLLPERYVHPDSLADFSRILRDLTPDSVVETPATHLRRGDAPFPIELNARPFTHAGQPCLLCVVRDVSDRAQTERMLRQQVEALHAKAQALAVLEERQRLAQDLHDAVNQSLFSAGLIAEVLPRLWEQDPEAGRRSLADLRRLTRGAAAEMRGLLAALRPSALADADLEELLRQLSNALMGRSELDVIITVDGRGTLPAAVQEMFYRLCQEALNNVAKHAAASRVTIRLRYLPGAVVLRIQDDGRGFDPKPPQPGHYGILMMRERAAAVGATLTLTSQPGRGTDVVIHWQGEAAASP